jgi:hypothetical protein
VHSKVEKTYDVEEFKNYIKTQTKNIRESGTDTKFSDLAKFIDQELNSDMQKFAEMILSIVLDKPVSLDTDSSNADYECAIVINDVVYLRYTESIAYDSNYNHDDPTDYDESYISYASDEQINEFFNDISQQDLEKIMDRFS